MPSRTLDRFDLTAKVVILTGGAGLLGRQLTQAWLGVGAKVVVADLTAENAEAAAKTASKATGGEAVGLAADISRKSDVEQLMRLALERFGRIDILINNAAIDPKFDAELAGKQAFTFEDYPLELWQQSLDVNLTGAFLCCQAAGKTMLRQGNGVIVNISSTYGLVAPDQRLYRTRRRRCADLVQTRFLCSHESSDCASDSLFGRVLGREEHTNQHAVSAWHRQPPRGPIHAAICSSFAARAHGFAR